MDRGGGVESLTSSPQAGSAAPACTNAWSGVAPRSSIGADDFLVFGGQQRRDRSLRELGDDWYGYGRGLVVRVRAGIGSTCLEYVSPPGACLPDDPVLLKSATVRGDVAYACTQTEVLVLQLPHFEVTTHISLPCFNDVHHVVPTSTGTMLVAVSGLDMVIEIDASGTVLNEWGVLGGDPWASFSPTTDYRMGVDLKPHRAHPNHVFLIDGEPFATRFEMRDAVSLDDARRRIPIGQERLHDGVVHEGRIYFTTVDGCVVIVDAERLEVERVVRLRAPEGPDVTLGWCRGLLLDGDHVWVGFSRIRHTRFRQAVSWARSGARSCPTRIARYHLDDGACDREIDLEPFGLNAVFTIAAVGAP